jgi:undecaprenyl-diphosphatase
MTTSPPLALIDAWILASLDRLFASLGAAGTRTLQEGAATITPLGASYVLAPIVALAAGWLAWHGRRRHAAWLLVTCTAAWGTMHAMKLAIARPRPDVAGHLVEAVGASFPSGHAMMSTVVALALWRVLAPDGGGPRRRPLAVAAAAVALLAVVAIGASRVLLGVHWPTDVLAGWALGAAWTALAGTRLRRPPPPAGPR